jgi:hypothetical protein
MRLALESLTRSAFWDVASTPALQQSCVFLTQNRYKSRRVAIHGNLVRINAHPTKKPIRALLSQAAVLSAIRSAERRVTARMSRQDVGKSAA